MVDAITGIAAFAMLFVFLGNYAIKLGSVPLWIIIVAILVMAAADVIQAIRKPPVPNSTK